ncbi:diacylglycerol O-acyltransferase 1 [Sporothrix schenckii 1099-18]|uniref:O-acyltransferase n=1 Tax=Sporothrix schenckii 1099-18 TaxID=1397361 RepID=A0A0F2MBM6_SPOSC|nr:diacylglycerol O-acyltransferase 1 [Sporothrix schenckii 1099-18]KJR86469.1 diacylglycerol O-acyltransferase 1 [Sporothrix schenckii 1099-18]
MNSSIGLAAHLAIGNGRCTTVSQTTKNSSPLVSALEDRAANDGSTAYSTSAASHANAKTAMSATNAFNASNADIHANTKAPVTDMADTTTAANASASGLTQRRNRNEPVPARLTKETSENDGTPIEPQHDDATIQQLRKAFQRKYRHVAAIHSKTQPSCLSHDSVISPSFLGFRNLMVIVLVAGNLRLMIENIQKLQYGVLICVRCHDFRQHDVLLGLVLFLSIPLHLFVALLIELGASQQAQVWRKRTTAAKLQNKIGAAGSHSGSSSSNGAKSSTGASSPTEDEARRFTALWHVVAWLHAANISMALAIASYVVYFHIHHPLVGTLVEVHAIVVWLKTASYAFTNRDLRHAYLHPSRGEREALPALYAQCPYPENITFGNLVYFWWAPTLVYQPAYPRAPGPIRWMFVAKRLAEVFGLSVFIWFCSAQYAAPVLQNSLAKIASLDLFAILERLLKLSTISLVVWLAGFFAVFQSFLNAIAEITRFGDRGFYDDWWNSESLGTYWRTWNKPVYHFFRRHVYSPLLGRGWSPMAASLMVFLISALLHELAVGIPTHNIIGVAFFGMLLQLPLIFLTMPLEKMHSATGRLIGNCTFWISFTVLGQPFAALMYFYAWQAKYGSVSKQLASHP